jgi:hypothetical protein
MGAMGRRRIVVLECAPVPASRIRHWTYPSVPGDRAPRVGRVDRLGCSINRSILRMVAMRARL